MVSITWFRILVWIRGVSNSFPFSYATCMKQWMIDSQWISTVNLIVSVHEGGDINLIPQTIFWPLSPRHTNHWDGLFRTRSRSCLQQPEAGPWVHDLQLLHAGYWSGDNKGILLELLLNISKNIIQAKERINFSRWSTLQPRHSTCPEAKWTYQ